MLILLIKTWTENFAEPLRGLRIATTPREHPDSSESARMLAPGGPRWERAAESVKRLGNSLETANEVNPKE